MTQGERENGPPDNWMHSIFFLFSTFKDFIIYISFLQADERTLKKNEEKYWQNASSSFLQNAQKIIIVF